MFPRIPGQTTLLGSSPTHPTAYGGSSPVGPSDTPNARRQKAQSISFPSPFHLASQRETSVPGVPCPVIYWLSSPVPFSSLSCAVLCAQSLQLCPTVCDAMDCSPPDSVHGILQARIPGRVAMPSSRASSRPRD